MRRQRLNRLSLAERDELNRQLKDAMEAGLIRPSYKRELLHPSRPRIWLLASSSV
jgi:hypothetical protein